MMFSICSGHGLVISFEVSVSPLNFQTSVSLNMLTLKVYKCAHRVFTHQDENHIVLLLNFHHERFM